MDISSALVRDLVRENTFGPNNENETQEGKEMIRIIFPILKALGQSIC